MEKEKMTFGSKRLDDAYDSWATQSPDDAGIYYEDDPEQTAQEIIDGCDEEDQE